MRRFAVVVLTLAAVACSASGDTPPPDATVHVDPSGSDGAAGTEVDPVPTLAAALDIVEPGDTILLAAGSHRGGHMIQSVTDVTIEGEPGAVLEGGGAAFGIMCDGCRNLTIRDLEITGFTDAGVLITGGESIALRGLAVHGNGFEVQFTEWELEGYGIHVDESVRVTIEGNDVYDNGPDRDRPSNPILGTGINTYGNSEVVISGNSSRDNRGGGILVEDSWNVEVSGNTVTGNDLDATSEDWWDGAIWVDGGAAVAVTGNTVQGNRGPGIQISDEEGSSPEGFVVTGNVSMDNTFGLLVWGFGGSGLPTTEVIRLEGNTIEGNEVLDVWVSSDWPGIAP